VTMKHALSEPGHRGRGADDAQPALREKVQQAMDPWQDLIVRAVHEGIANGEPDLEDVPKGVAPLAFSSMEGPVMMSKLYGAPTTFTGP
jgi:TetR/AcrR family transcriptional repressor of nem operon